MGVSTSRFSFRESEYQDSVNQFYSLRAHTNILIVGNKFSGKTRLCEKIKEITRPGKAFVHIFDSGTVNLNQIDEKLKDVYKNGVDTSGLSMVSSKMPIHGIIWVIDAREIETTEEFQRVRETCSRLRSFIECFSCVFFSHTDVSNRDSIAHIRALFTECPEIPNSGEYAPERIYYAPLVGQNKDADFTILQIVKHITGISIIRAIM